MASLKFQGIIKHYTGNSSRTLDGINLDVEDGEFLVLVGPSGCGKSTLLRIIAGLESISGGELMIGDRVVNKVPPRDRDIAMVFQSYALYPHMTVRRNMAFGLEVRKTPRAEIAAEVAKAAKMLDLEPYLDKLPKNLSGGQRQRVAMGRAIVRRPSIFLFDEPLSNLDASLRTQMRVEIKRLHQKLKTTMVYVTHDQVEAMTLADRIAVLNLGVLQQVGSPMELFYSPANHFVASFIGSPSMNFLPATLRMDSNGSRLDAPGFTAPITLPPDHSKCQDGQGVIMGVRPQSLILAENPSETILTPHVDLIETLGWEAHLHMEHEGIKLLAVLDSQKIHRFNKGDSIPLKISPEEILLFDPKNGEALFRRSVSSPTQTSGATDGS